MTYQILLLVKADANQPLWTYHMITLAGETVKSIWETTNKAILDTKVTELLGVYLPNEIKIISPVDYSVDVVIP